MSPDLLHLSPPKRLLALQELDIFHLWSSLDEKRICRRCGALITGRDILIYRGRQNEKPARLQCPTPDCLAVPLEWIMVEPEVAAQTDPHATRSAPPRRAKRRPEAKRFVFSDLFRFLRAPQIFY